ncbi:hypothetical protein B0H13DRAFT_1891553 [Mycena leptocephala]|nr:hypothetical protein B0H13DRAFT_1891553 [Mycena leptocephala]
MCLAILPASNVKPKTKTTAAASRKKTTANAILEVGPDFTAYTREDDRLATELNLDGPPIPIIHPKQLEEVLPAARARALAHVKAYADHPRIAVSCVLAFNSSKLEDLKRAETQFATATLMADEAERNYVFFLRRTLKCFMVDYSELAPNDPALADPTVQRLSAEAVNFCHLLHVDIGSTISIDDKIALAARTNYGSFTRPVPPSSLPLEAEPVVKLEVRSKVINYGAFMEKGACRRGRDHPQLFTQVRNLTRAKSAMPAIDLQFYPTVPSRLLMHRLRTMPSFPCSVAHIHREDSVFHRWGARCDYCEKWNLPGCSYASLRAWKLMYGNDPLMLSFSHPTVFAELFYRNGTEELTPSIFEGFSPRSGYPHGWVLKERTLLSEMMDVHDLGHLRDQYLDSNRRFMVRLVDERIAMIQANTPDLDTNNLYIAPKKHQKKRKATDDKGLRVGVEMLFGQLSIGRRRFRSIVQKTPSWKTLRSCKVWAWRFTSWTAPDKFPRLALYIIAVDTIPLLQSCLTAFMNTTSLAVELKVLSTRPDNSTFRSTTENSEPKSNHKIMSNLTVASGTAATNNASIGVAASAYTIVEEVLATMLVQVLREAQGFALLWFWSRS